MWTEKTVRVPGLQGRKVTERPASWAPQSATPRGQAGGGAGEGRSSEALQRRRPGGSAGVKVGAGGCRGRAGRPAPLRDRDLGIGSRARVASWAQLPACSRVDPQLTGWRCPW